MSTSSSGDIAKALQALDKKQNKMLQLDAKFGRPVAERKSANRTSTSAKKTATEWTEEDFQAASSIRDGYPGDQYQENSESEYEGDDAGSMTC